jgi:ribosomal protein L11 methyltransferase
LDALAEVLANATAPGGRLAMSGILKGQEGDLLQRFSPWFDGLAVSTQEDWVRIEGVRRV